MKMQTAVAPVALSWFLAAMATATTLQLNSAGDFAFSGVSNSGAYGSITNVGMRELNASFLGRVTDALRLGVNGQGSDLNPVAVDIGLSITVDRLKYHGDDQPFVAEQQGGGAWSEARYSGANLDDWGIVILKNFNYAPDALFGFANLSYDRLDTSNSLMPFAHASEIRNGTTPFGAYGIRDTSVATYYTIGGSWIETDFTYLLARTSGSSLEIAGAWGYHERVNLVPAPGTCVAAVAFGLIATRRRRATAESL